MNPEILKCVRMYRIGDFQTFQFYLHYLNLNDVLILSHFLAKWEEHPLTFIRNHSTHTELWNKL